MAFAVALSELVMSPGNEPQVSKSNEPDELNV